MVASDDEDDIPLLRGEETKKKPPQQERRGGDVSDDDRSDDRSDASSVRGKETGIAYAQSEDDVPWTTFCNPVWQWRRMVEWLRLLFDVYGWKLCVILILAQHLLKGFVFAYITTSLDFVFKFYAVEGPRVQIFKVGVFGVDGGGGILG